jgi:predicted glycosyltransferase involved in capsule biosynthesis
MKTLAVIIPLFNLDTSKYRVQAFEYVIRQITSKLRPKQIILSEQVIDLKHACTIYAPKQIATHLKLVQSGDFNKSKSINAAIASVTADVILILDADVVLDWCAVNDSVQTLAVGSVCKPFSEVYRLNKQGTFSYTQTNKIVKSQITSSVNLLGGGAILMHLIDFHTTGGFDERYIGWGAEDAEFGRTCRSLFKVVEISSAAYHLYHERDEQALTSSTNYRRNLALYKSTKYTKSALITNNHPLVTSFVDDVISWA